MIRETFPAPWPLPQPLAGRSGRRRSYAHTSSGDSALAAGTGPTRPRGPGDHSACVRRAAGRTLGTAFPPRQAVGLAAFAQVQGQLAARPIRLRFSHQKSTGSSSRGDGQHPRPGTPEGRLGVGGTGSPGPLPPASGTASGPTGPRPRCSPAPSPFPSPTGVFSGGPGRSPPPRGHGRVGRDPRGGGAEPRGPAPRFCSGGCCGAAGRGPGGRCALSHGRPGFWNWVLPGAGGAPNR